METRHQELYSGVLSEAVVDWGSMGPGEEWVNTTKREGERGKTRLSQIKNGGREVKSMLNQRAGFLDSEPLREADEDMASELHLNSSLTEEEREDILQELSKLEEEIGTLKQVLASKEQQHAELKQKLGATSLADLRNNLSRGWHDVQTSTAYKKTSETLSTAGQKTSAAFSTLGSAITRKFGDMRNSPSFKSFEEKVETTVSTIKTKVGGTEAGGSFEEVLSSAAHASVQDTPTNSLTDGSERPR
ncbi:tumor protein D53 isoform X7 [Pungitius pungitius]|uniref:tumor protein D53 isoform X7 n=1 Tax=Pungitius pungitius TaxID=134920 RepID=UPI002E0DEF20